MMCHHEMYLHKATRISAPHDVRPKKWMVQYTDLAYPEFTHPANTHPALCTTWLARSKGKKKKFLLSIANGPKWSQMVPIWSKMVPNGPKWSQLGPKWSQMAPNGPKRVPNGPQWSQIAQIFYVLIVPYGFKRSQMVPNGPKYLQIAPKGSKWVPNGP